MNQLSQFIPSLIGLIATAVLGYIGKQVVKLIPCAIEYVVSKVGLNNYDKLKKTAWDVWNAIEEDTRLGNLVEAKIVAFATRLRLKYPQISDAEIDEIRQAIAGEFNKDKPLLLQGVLQATEPVITAPLVTDAPVQAVTVLPTVKYYDELGNELVPAPLTPPSDVVVNAENTAPVSGDTAESTQSM